MKSLFCLLTALTAAILPSSAWDMVATNAYTTNAYRVVNDTYGTPIPTGYGTLSVGCFVGITDAEITAKMNTPFGTDEVISKFYPFSQPARVGITQVSGGFNKKFSAPAASGSFFYGKRIYVVVGNRESLQGSSGLIVIRTPSTFGSGFAGSFTLPGYNGAPYSGLLFGNQLSNGQYVVTTPAKPTWEQFVDKFSVLCPDGDWSQEGDPDEDGLTNLEELGNCLDPTDADTDADGIRDWSELYPNIEEPRFGGGPQLVRTDGLSQDTDGDGYIDGDEIVLGHNPAMFSDKIPLRQNLARFWSFDGHPADLITGAVMSAPGARWDASHTHRGLRIGYGAAPEVSAAMAVPASAPGFGLSFWMRVGRFTQTNERIAGQQGAWQLDRAGDSGLVRFTFADRSVVSALPLDDGEMHHIALTVRFDSRVELWIDGMLQGRTDAPAFRPSMDTELTFGSGSLLAWIDEAIWWNRFLTGPDIVAVATTRSTMWAAVPGNADTRVRATWIDRQSDGSERFCMAWALPPANTSALLESTTAPDAAWQPLVFANDPFFAEPVTAGSAPRFFRVRFTK